MPPTPIPTYFHPVDPKRHHRDKHWNYKGRGVYHITLATAERYPLFGQLAGTDEDSAHVALNPFGKAVCAKFQHISKVGKERGYALKVLAVCVMPDHLHGVIHVQEPLPVSIGQIIRGFKSGCTSLYKNQFAPLVESIGNNANEMSKVSSLMTDLKQFASIFARGNSIWQPDIAGYHETILHRDGQLERMIAYVHDNPRRALLKRMHPDLFRLRRNLNVTVAPGIALSFSAMGNVFLLDYPEKVAVQCSRSMTEEEIEIRKREVLEQASRGAVCVSAAISEGEKQICRAIRESGYPLIILMKEGFPDDKDESSRYYKPGGVYFDACAAGRLLLLESQTQAYEIEEIRQTVNAKTMAELPHTTDRYRFLALNKMAEMICQ